MRILIQPIVFGRNRKGEYVYDWANSCKNVIGVFANTQTIAIVVIQVYFQGEQYDILDNWVRIGSWKLEEGHVKIKEFSNKYYVKYYLGNTIGECLYTGYTNRSLHDGEVIEGWESTQFNIETMYIKFQNNLKNIQFAENLKDEWYEELKSFDIVEALENKKTYPRLFALFHILTGVKVSYNAMFVDYPDTLVEESGQVIIHPHDEKKINDAFQYICNYNDYVCKDKNGNRDFYKILRIDTRTLCGISGVSEILVKEWMRRNKSMLDARGNF